MTREETAKLLAIINATYPNFKVENKTVTLDAWTWALEDYPFEAIQMAYKIYIRSDKSGFAPSVNQLITKLQKPAEINMPSESEAWALVKKALKNGNYGYQEEYDKLPEVVQKVVGGASQIREWAGMDSDEVNTVVASNFQRSYKTIANREKEKMFIGREVNVLGNMVSTISNKLAGNSTERLAIEKNIGNSGI